MSCKADNVSKYALFACNLILLVSGICLVALGCILANDAPRLLLSILAVEPGPHVQPLLYYVALGLLFVGMTVCIVSALGCWACIIADKSCLMSTYIFLLVVLLMSEISFGVVAALCPQLLGVDLQRDTMVENLQRSYGLPAGDHYTAAVDLAQILFECCGMSSGADYDNSFWREREVETSRDWRVPLSCCIIQNTRETTAFLDPHPLNKTLCQAKTNALYQQGRHTVGCIDQLNTWFNDHSAIFLTTGLSLIVVQLCVLVSSIFFCVKRNKVEENQEGTQHEFPDSSPQPRVVVTPLESAQAVRNDEKYPEKEGKGSTSLPLGLLNQHFANHGENYYRSPKVYNTDTSVLDNLHRNNRKNSAAFYNSGFDSRQGT